ncbi:Ig-like domain-containing protein [Spirosoma rhododendri]|uniref:Ig-like domain-containing protein n=1 Tax=Spirosoma rhododendri TaxID=2728024 RepID=A0A7L5DTP2_9BACT|nr:hypothetical protein [Spirosoma rhododendri]QJD81505.1 hypothetical protein HH216_24340 [Spirosoma rhododendri]
MVHRQHGGVGSATAPTPPTSTVGSTTYYVSQTINGCEGPRAVLTVTINPLPNAPTTTNISYCQNATAAPLTASGQNLRWYTAAGGGTPSTTVTPSTSTAGSTTYYVTQTDNNSCESARTPLTVTINAAPPAPAVTNTAVSYCQNTTAQPLQATATSGNTLNWYTSQGTALGSTAPTPSTTNPGTSTYQVSQRNTSGCESDRVPITVTINALPVAPATSPASACQGGAPVSLVSRVTATGTLKWYTSPTSASLAAAPQVGTASTGSQVFYVSQTNASGCESSRAAITYTVYARPNPPAVQTPVTYCQNAVAQPLQATASPGGILNFYTQASGGVPSIELTPSTQASEIYYVSQTVNGCESSTRASITVTINALPPSPAVTTPVTYCQLAPASPLSATVTSTNTLTWYGTDGQPLTGAPTPRRALPVQFATP